MSDLQEWRLWPDDERRRLDILRLFGECAVEVVMGQPRRMAETFFQVENKDKTRGLAVVPLGFTDNQEYYYRECFSGRRGCWEPLYVVGDKARQAYMSVFWEAMWFAHFLMPLGWKVALFAHRDDMARTLMGYVDVMWDGLPTALKAPPYGTNPGGLRASSWTADRKELDFGGGVVNCIHSYSAESNTVPRGGRYSCVHFSEGAHYKERYWAEVSAAVAPMQPAWEIWDSSRRGTTYPETGNPNQHYVQVQALKEGAVRGKLLQRFWFQDRANALSNGSARSLPGQEGAFDLTPDELALAGRFPQDEVRAQDRIRWRRAEVARYILKNGRNARRGMAVFQQENLEYEGNWSNAERTPFDVALVHRYLDQRMVPFEDSLSATGVKVQLLRAHVVGNDCAAGMDAASGKRDGDATSVSIIDAGDGNARVHVARLIGQVSPRAMMETALTALRRYGEPLFGIESTGGWGEGAIQTAHDAGYPRLYMRPMWAGEQPETYARSAACGFETTLSSKNRILQRLIDDFNDGRFKTYFPDTLHMLENYDPASGGHTPDELMSLAIANEIAGYDERVWTNRRAQEREGRERSHLSGRREREPAGAAHTGGWHVWGR